MVDPTRPNVLVIGRFYADSFGENIAAGFEAMGHRVTRFEAGVDENIGAGILQKRIDQARRRLHDFGASFRLIRERWFSRVLEAAKGAAPQLVLTAHDFLMPHEVERLRDLTGAKLALWFPDHVGVFGRMWFLDGPYDALFFKDPFIIWKLGRMLDRPIFYLPECFNPQTHRAGDLSDAERERYGCDIATAGNLHAYRAAFFERLADYDVRIWGHPPPIWMRSRATEMVQNHYVVNEEKARIFLAAKAVVNNLHPGEVWGLNARAFEVAGVGAFQLLDWVPGLAQLFEDGQEAVSFTSMADLRDKLGHYLSRPDDRRAIAAAGKARALRDHTYEQRLQLMLDTVFDDAEGFPVPTIEMRAV